MSSDELKAWLLLAGFDRHWLKRTHRYARTNYGDQIHHEEYIVVDFLPFRVIEVITPNDIRKFIRRRTAQQYIQSIIGD